MDDVLFPPPPEHGPVPQYPIDSVDNALKVLLLLGERPRLRLTDVSQYLGVASSSAHRLLAALQYRGFVRQETDTRSYVPGPSLDVLAMEVLRRLDVRTLARPILEKLNAELQETVHLGRLEGNNVHYIDSIESRRALRVGGRLGRSLPAHCTSNGKALLSTLSEGELKLLYPHEELPQLTPWSISTRTRLMEVLEEVRTRGYARSEEESEEGVMSVAVPLSPRHKPRLAVTASAPVSRLNDQNRAEILSHLFAAVEDLDRTLV